MDATSVPEEDLPQAMGDRDVWRKLVMDSDRGCFILLISIQMGLSCSDSGEKRKKKKKKILGYIVKTSNTNFTVNWSTIEFAGLG